MKRINISLPDELHTEVAQFCEANDMTLSGLIAQQLKKTLQGIPEHIITGDVINEAHLLEIITLLHEIPKKTLDLIKANPPRDYDRNPLPSKDLEYQPGYFENYEKEAKLAVAREALKQATSSPEAAKPISKGLSRCNICHQLRENVRPVEYLFEGDRTVDEMCTGCIGKIPQEMQIKDTAITPGSMTAVFPGDTTANRGDYFKPFPKPEKKKKK